MKAKELMKWGYHVLLPAAKNTTRKDAPLKAGTWCQFCPAWATCMTHEALAHDVATTKFLPDTKELCLAEPEELTQENITKVLHFASMLKSWLGKVEDFVQQKAERGVKFPGYKLVKKRSVRKWNDPGEAERFLLEVLGSEGPYTEPKLVTPAEAERRLKKIKRKDLMDDLTVKPDNGYNLVPMEDRRQEVEVEGRDVLSDYAEELGTKEIKVKNSLDLFDE